MTASIGRAIFLRSNILVLSTVDTLRPIQNPLAAALVAIVGQLVHPGDALGVGDSETHDDDARGHASTSRLEVRDHVVAVPDCIHIVE
jgi:hypothetical protein